MSVKVHRLVSAHILVAAGRCLSFTDAGKGLDASVGHSVHGCSRPCGAVLAISKACPTGAGSNAEVASCRAHRSPPDTVLHAILCAHDALHHVVQLVVGSDVSIGFHVRVEVGVVVEVASQLVRVSLAHVGLHVVIPLLGAIIVAGVACHDAYTLEEGILAYQLGHGLEVRHGALVAGCDVRLVEGAYRHHVQSILLDILRGRLDHLVPSFGVMGICLHVDVHGVAVEHHAVGFTELDMLYARVEELEMTVREGAVGIQRVHHLKRDTSIRKVILTYEVDAAQDIAFIVPCCIHAPLDGGGHTSPSATEGNLYGILATGTQKH